MASDLSETQEENLDLNFLANKIQFLQAIVLDVALTLIQSCMKLSSKRVEKTH